MINSYPEIGDANFIKCALWTFKQLAFVVIWRM